MFELFSKNAEGYQDVKTLRDALLRNIKEELQKAEGGEGHHIRGIQLFIASPAIEKHLYESAVCIDEQDRFKEEIQRISDDFDIGLPDGWTLESIFVDALPSKAKLLSDLPAALFIKTKQHNIQKTGTASLRVLSGEAEKEEYTITSESGKINIGREQKAQTDEGFFRINQVAFPGNSNNECNKYISRQHAHIEWDNDAGCFVLFADEGGVPPRNKIKIKSLDSDDPIKLNSTHIGHRLKDGDQVILGETAVIEFSASQQT